MKISDFPNTFSTVDHQQMVDTLITKEKLVNIQMNRSVEMKALYKRYYLNVYRMFLCSVLKDGAVQ